MRVLREARIREFTKDREHLEAEVADKLGEYLFETFATTYKGIALGIVQMFEGRALRFNADRFRTFLKNEKPYDMWKYAKRPCTMEGLWDICRFIYRSGDKSILYALSDLIRLMGEWIEVCHAYKLFFMDGGFDGKERLKPKPTFQKTVVCPYCKSRSISLVVTGPVESTFKCESKDHYNKVGALLGKPVKSDSDRELIDRLKTGRLYFTMENQLPGHRDRGLQDKEESEESKLTKGSGSHYWPIIRDLVALRGIERWKLEKNSVIRAIDETYGLSQGGDVSGTTTDSMYILESIHGMLRPQIQAENADLWALQLIALATLVHAGHHTIVECAYPLTRWNKIDYKIGFYSSLTPNEANMDARSLARVDEVYRKLRTYDHKVPHILTWKDKSPATGGVIKLGIEFDKGEASSLRASTKFFNVLSAYSMCAAGPLPSTKDAFNMLNLCDKTMSMDLVDTLCDYREDWSVQYLGQAVFNWAHAKNLYDRRRPEAHTTRHVERV